MQIIILRSDEVKAMQINITSLKKIIGNSKELMFYGFGYCHYLDVYENINFVREFKSYCFLGGKFPKIEFDEGNDSLKNSCKAVITSILIENYKRTKQGLPIIPLIFCVGYAGDDNHFTLDLDKVAQRGKVSTTLPELRRCFKSCVEMGPEIKKIANQTIKFVQVKQDQVDKSFGFVRGQN